MIHVRDLSRLVRQVAFSPDLLPVETPFFLAVDQPPAPPEKAPEPSAVASPEQGTEAAQEDGEAAEAEDAGEEGQAAKEEQGGDGSPAPAEEAAEAAEAGDGEDVQQEMQTKSMPSTQAEVVQGIVDEMADHYDVPVIEPSSQAGAEPEDDFPSAGDTVSLNLLVEPSKIMLDEEFAWWCREGMVANIRKIAGEFCAQRELRAMRIVVA